MPAIDRGVKGLRVGVLKEGFGQPAGPGFPGSDAIVDRKCKAAIKELERQGAIAPRFPCRCISTGFICGWESGSKAPPNS